MSIPVRERDTSWPRLDQAAKKERLLKAAAEVFARDGLDASMPTIAAAAGAGVASVYRQFDSKHDLLAALVERRLEQVAEGAQRAANHGRQPLVCAHGTAVEPRRTAIVRRVLRRRDAQGRRASGGTRGKHARLRGARTAPCRRAHRRATPPRRIHSRSAAALRRNPRCATHRTGSARRMLQLLIDGLDTGRVDPYASCTTSGHVFLESIEHARVNSGDAPRLRPRPNRTRAG